MEVTAADNRSWWMIIDRSHAQVFYTSQMLINMKIGFQSDERMGY